MKEKKEKKGSELVNAREKNPTSLVKKEGFMGPAGMRPMGGWDPMHDMFRDFFRSLRPSEFYPSMSPASGMENLGWPKMDMYEKDGNLMVEVALPGIKKDDISVQLSEDTLTIKGSAESEEEMEGEETYFRERFQGTFSRTVSLPCEVLSDRIKAAFKDGVLKMTLPMKEPSGKKKIQVKIE